MAVRSVDPIRIQKALQKIGMPRGLRDRSVIGLKKLSAPTELARRKTAAKDMPSPAGIDLDLLRQKGAGQYAAKAFPKAEDAVAKARQIFGDTQASREQKRTAGDRKSNFLITVSDSVENIQHDEIINFILSDEVISTATHYFGQVPILSAAKLWWSPPNESLAESQYFHYDGEDTTQIKVFLHIEDVTPASGPFTYLDAIESERIPRTKRLSARLSDDLVHQHVQPDAAVPLTGPAGTVGFVDTSRCLHYGSRGNSADRLVLMVQFTRFFAPKAAMPKWHLPASTAAALSKVQRMVLNLPT